MITKLSSMDGPTDERPDGQTDGWKEGEMDGWTGTLNEMRVHI